jgi:hypothetical protein
MMLHTTFLLLKKHEACAEGYRKLARKLGGVRKYGEDTPIPIARIIDTNNLDDALWSLRAVLPEQAAARDKLTRLFACWCARQVWHLLTDERSRMAVEVAEKYAVGEATAKELEAAEKAAWDAEGAVWDAEGAAARDAAGAAWDAEGVAWAAEGAVARAAAREKQAAKLREMLEAEG